MADCNYQELNWQKIPQLKRLNDLPNPPKKLYFQGNWNPKIFDTCVAVVGSRKMSDYGQRVIEKIVPQLVATGKTIISGFMWGVDKYAHQICVESGGKTVGVLGWGIADKLTGEDLKLTKEIIECKGGLLSEWENQKASLWTFPTRNRIVAALCDEVIVVEAAKKSGSLITARIANSLKRTVFAVPGPVTSRTSQGTNYLIAQGRAKMWLPQNNQATSPKIDDPVLQLLENGTQSANDIARKLKVPISEIGARLSFLQLSGQIEETAGKYYLCDAG